MRGSLCARGCAASRRTCTRVSARTSGVRGETRARENLLSLLLLLLLRLASGARGDLAKVRKDAEDFESRVRERESCNRAANSRDEATFFFNLQPASSKIRGRN